MQTRSRKPVPQQDKTKTRIKPSLKQENSKPKAKPILQHNKSKPKVKSVPQLDTAELTPKTKLVPQQDIVKPTSKAKNGTKTSYKGKSLSKKGGPVSVSIEKTEQKSRSSRQSVKSTFNSTTSSICSSSASSGPAHTRSSNKQTVKKLEAKSKNVSTTPKEQSISSVISTGVSGSASSDLNTRSRSTHRGSQRSIASTSTTKSVSSVISTAVGSSSSSQSENDKLTETISKNGTKSSESLGRTPVWKKSASVVSVASTLFDFKVKRRSSRVSQHINKDVYEFSFIEDKENIKIAKKKKRKPQIKKKKLKPSMKTAMLTTGPMNKPLPNAISPSAFYVQKNVKILTSVKGSVNFNDDDDHDDLTVDSHFDDEPVDDAGYEASISVANDTENTTAMSLANPPVSILPTPKGMLRFPASSSTPYGNNGRNEFNSFTTKRARVPFTKEEEFKLCFGFDESDEDLSLGLSPVKKTKQLSILHQASREAFSNVEEIEPMATRFTNFKRPLPLNFEKENAKQIQKKRCTPTNNTKENQMKKNKDESKCVSEMDSTSASELCNTSVLFELNTNERLLSPLKKSNESKKKNKNIPKKGLRSYKEPEMFSPVKIKALPRKSYDRRSLEAVREKFLCELAGGYPTTETETEDEGSSEVNQITRRKRREVPNKTYKKKKNKSKENITPLGGAEKSKKGLGKIKNKLDKDEEWVSDINSHFSEIEDMDLMIE